jgi:hypothetical protein
MTNRDVYVDIHTCIDCSCGSTSNQLTLTVERDFVRKCCRELTVIGFSSALYVFLTMQHSIWMVSWTDITAEFGVVSHLKKFLNIRTCQRLMFSVAWWKTVFFQEATVTSHSYEDILEHYTVTVALAMHCSSRMECPHIFEILSVFKWLHC